MPDPTWRWCHECGEKKLMVKFICPHCGEEVEESRRPKRGSRECPGRSCAELIVNRALGCKKCGWDKGPGDGQQKRKAGEQMQHSSGPRSAGVAAAGGVPAATTEAAGGGLQRLLCPPLCQCWPWHFFEQYKTALHRPQRSNPESPPALVRQWAHRMVPAATFLRGSPAEAMLRGPPATIDPADHRRRHRGSSRN